MATVGFAYIGSALASSLGASAAAVTAAQAVGAVVGSILDSAVMALLAGPQKGPRLDGLRSGGYDEGNDAVRVFGKARTAGQVIWASDLREVQKETSTGIFGTTKLVNYDYYIDVAVAFTRQPSELDEPVEKLWAQGVLVYDSNADESKSSGLVSITTQVVKKKFGGQGCPTLITGHRLIYTHDDPTKVVYNFFEDYVVDKTKPVQVSGAINSENNGTFQIVSVEIDADGVPGRSRMTVARCNYNVSFAPPNTSCGTSTSDGCFPGVAEPASGNILTFVQEKPELNPQTLQSVTQYNGQEDQMPDPIMELFEGDGNVPAHRGTGYILIRNLQVSRWGGAIPQIDALWKQRASTTVQQAILDVLRICDRIDVEKQVDVSQVTGTFTGMLMAASMSPAEAILQIMLVHDVEVQLTTLVSDDGERINGLRFFDRELSDEVSVPDTARGVGEFDADELAVVRNERSDPDTKPLMVSVAFQDHDRDYQPGLRSYRRQPNAASRAETVNLNVTLAPADADALAKKIAWYLSINEQSALSVRLPPSYIAVQEGDRLLLNGVDDEPKEIRLGQVDRGANYVMDVSGYEDYLPAYIQTGVAGSSNYKSFISGVPDIIWVVQDLPAIKGDSVDQTVVLAVASATTPGVSFPGATYFVSTDSGASYYEDVTTGIGGAVGILVSGLSDDASGRHYDKKSELIVQFYADTPELFPAPASVVAAGTANWLAIGQEIVGFIDVEKIAPRRYKLTNLLRGRRNTESFINSHEDGETIMMVSDASAVLINLGFASHNQWRTIAATPPGIGLTDVVPDYVKAESRSRRPFGPALRQAYRDAAGNVQINWRRRTRSFFRLLGGTAAPLDEPTEEYVLRILDGPGGTVLRTVNISGTTTYSYTSAMQGVDFGGLESAIDIEIWQVSATIGAGNVTTGVV